MNMKPYLICCATAVFLGLLFAHLFRYSIIGVGDTGAYKIDRWTGKMVIMWGTKQVLVNPAILSASDYLSAPDSE